MRDSDRTSIFNLLFEKRNYTSVASKDIAKTDCRKLCLTLLSDRLNDHLTESLARPHNIGRIDRFVCRN